MHFGNFGHFPLKKKYTSSKGNAQLDPPVCCLPEGRGSSVFCSQSLSLIRAYSLTEKRICPAVRYLPLAEIHFWAALKGASQDIRQGSQIHWVIRRTSDSSVFP